MLRILRRRRARHQSVTRRHKYQQRSFHYGFSSRSSSCEQQPLGNRSRISYHKPPDYVNGFTKLSCGENMLTIKPRPKCIFKGVSPQHSADIEVIAFRLAPTQLFRENRNGASILHGHAANISRDTFRKNDSPRPSRLGIEPNPVQLNSGNERKCVLYRCYRRNKATCSQQEKNYGSLHLTLPVITLDFIPFGTVTSVLPPS